VDTKSLAHPAPQTTPEQPRRHCAECGDPSGSISQGTGFPLVRDKESGEFFHVRCMPGTESLDAVWSGLARMGAS
jgi:hypothetical protein